MLQLSLVGQPPAPVGKLLAGTQLTECAVVTATLLDVVTVAALFPFVARRYHSVVWPRRQATAYRKADAPQGACLDD